MTRTIRTALLAASTVVALSGTGCKDHSHDAPSADDPETLKFQQEQCAGYLDSKEPVLVKDCLDKKRVPAARMGEAQAIVRAAATVRSDAFAHLQGGNPDVLAMMKRWTQANALEPVLTVGVYIHDAEPVYFALAQYDPPHSSVFSANNVANDLRSIAKDKLPGVDFAVGHPCNGASYNLDFDVTITVHDSGQMQTFDTGKEQATVFVLAYDTEVVACYGDQRVTVASLKDKAMPLPDGYQLTSDARSGNAIAELEMDRRALGVVLAVIDQSLGLQ